MSHKEGLTHMDRIHIRLKNRVRFLNRVMFGVEEEDYFLFDSIMDEDCHKTYVTIRFMNGCPIVKSVYRWVALMIKGKPYLVSRYMCMSLRTKENCGKIDMGYVDLVKVNMEIEEDEIVVLREEIEDLKEAVDNSNKTMIIASEAIDICEIENEKLKAEAIVLKERIVTLEGENIKTTTAINIKDNDMTILKEEYRQDKERLVVVNNKVIELEEEIVTIREELKRKRADEDNVMNDVPNDQVLPDSDNTESKQCIACKKTKTLSSFQSKKNKKNKEEKLVSYATIRDICHTCKTTMYRENKKAKISK